MSIRTINNDFDEILEKKVIVDFGGRKKEKKKKENFFFGSHGKQHGGRKGERINPLRVQRHA